MRFTTISKQRVFIIALCVAAASATTLSAAEIRLRPEANVTGPIITLDDVAYVMSADSETSAALSAVELRPAPSLNSRYSLSMRELQDLLHSRGFNLAELDFSGAAVCVVTHVLGRSSLSGSMASTRVRQLNGSVQDVIAAYLKRAVSSDIPWSVEADLTPAEAQQVELGGKIVSIRGGVAPWFGPQRFELTFETADRVTQQPIRMWFDVTVDAPSPRVKAVRSLQRGSMINVTDLEIEYVKSSEVTGDHFQTIEEVDGMEATQSIGEGRAVTRQQVSAPLLVRRNQVVQVLSRAAGVEVRVWGRASQDGALNDVIRIQPLERGRDSYFGRVTGPQQVEVFASPVRSSSYAGGVGTASGAGLGQTGQVQPAGYFIGLEVSGEAPAAASAAGVTRIPTPSRPMLQRSAPATGYSPAEQRISPFAVPRM